MLLQMESKKMFLKALFLHLSEKNISLDKVVVIGYDNTSINRGLKKKFIQNLEEPIGMLLRWCIYHLHFSELPFRQAFQDINGKKHRSGIIFQSYR